MTEDTPPPEEGPASPTVTGRYGRLSLGEDGVVVYDRYQTEAWIHSDVSYALPVPSTVEVVDPGDGRDADVAGSEGD